MNVSPAPLPTQPVTVGNGYHTASALPSAAPAKLEAAALPTPPPASLGWLKEIGNANTYKVAALDALDASTTFRAAPGSSVEQAVAAAALLAQKLPSEDVSVDGANMQGQTASYAVLAQGSDLYVTPLWMKSRSSTGAKIGQDVDGHDNGDTEHAGPGVAGKAADASWIGAVGTTRWIDVRGTAKA